jgi:hypothetical protein
MGVVVIDIHPVMPNHLEKHMGKVSGALPIAAEESGCGPRRRNWLLVPLMGRLMGLALYDRCDARVGEYVKCPFRTRLGPQSYFGVAGPLYDISG